MTGHRSRGGHAASRAGRCAPGNLGGRGCTRDPQVRYRPPSASSRHGLALTYNSPACSLCRELAKVKSARCCEGDWHVRHRPPLMLLGLSDALLHGPDVRLTAQLGGISKPQAAARFMRASGYKQSSAELPSLQTKQGHWRVLLAAVRACSRLLQTQAHKHTADVLLNWSLGAAGRTSAKQRRRSASPSAARSWTARATRCGAGLGVMIG